MLSDLRLALRLLLRWPELLSAGARAGRPDKRELQPIAVGHADGKRLNWFVLTPRGEPLPFGTWDSENGSVFGPLASNGSINYPKWGAVPAGLWRYEIVRIVTRRRRPRRHFVYHPLASPLALSAHHFPIRHPEPCEGPKEGFAHPLGSFARLRMTIYHTP